MLHVSRQTWFLFCVFFFFFKQKTAYEIGTGDWSSDVCSSDLPIVSLSMRDVKLIPILSTCVAALWFADLNTVVLIWLVDLIISSSSNKWALWYKWECWNSIIALFLGLIKNLKQKRSVKSKGTNSLEKLIILNAPNPFGNLKLGQNIEHKNSLV